MATRQLYKVVNSALPTTAAPVEQPTGTAVRTMLQIASLSTRGLGVASWGISFDGSAAAQPIQVELFGTTVAATMSTALAAADVLCYTDENAPASTALLQFSTTTSAFATGAVTEGTVANYRHFDLQQVAPTSQYVREFPLGSEPMIDVSQFIRVRVTAAASVNAYIFVDIFAL